MSDSLSWRNHPSLAASIALPAALVLYCALTAWLPRLIAGQPQYDALFLSNYTPDANNALHIEIQDQHASAVFVGENFGYGWPHLYRFSPATGRLTEIPVRAPRELPVKRPYNRPSLGDDEPRISVPIPALESLRLLPSPTAPDGYVFTAQPADLAAEDVWNLAPQSSATITKNGARIDVPMPGNRGNASIKFLGWIVP